ncbi:mannitol dehydrogenase family protein [Aestuariivirga sp.]|uniref:mannitol dehydrogenase family protein n=1 Tax=Aestuariivirga sp. TaxID=2650926 RepID=UPI003BAB4384
MTMLSRATLAGLKPGIAVPNYRADQLSPGILHFGLGNFHRAHQAVYLDTLFNMGKSRDWAIIGTGVRPADRQMHDALAPQDWLTTVVEQEANVSRARVTGAMVDFIAPEEREAIVAKLADPAIRIVSITVTEGGYFIDPATGQFNPAFPEIARDGKTPQDPHTVFGLIALGLKKRRDAGVKPFTVMSCDNIPHNGVVARNAVSGVARLYDAGLADWIAATASFPNGMVDRITPATTDRERQLCAQDFGIEDNWPVYCEEFIQWVLEDDFCNGRPQLEAAGVQFVADVTPFEFMKIRILNGGHAAIAYPASLLGIHFVHDAMNHPLVGAFFAKIEREDIMPTVPPVPGVVLEDYYRLIHRRFSNPKIGDTIPRLAFDGSNRQPKFIVPVARDRLKAGASIDALAFESALWCRHCFGKTETGRDITAGDPLWPRLTALAQKAKADPLAWLSMDDVYGDVAQAEVFRTAFAKSLGEIWSKGTERALGDFVES